MTTATTGDIVVATTSFASSFGDYRRGQRVRASDDVVAAHPALFVPEGVPDAERPSEWDSIVKENERKEHEEREAAAAAFATEAAKHKVKFPEPDIVTAKADFIARYLGRPTTIAKGSKVLADHELVVDHPEMWKA